MPSEIRRPSDAAVAVARLMNDLALFLNDRDFPYPSNGLAGTLDAVPIINALLVASADGHGMTATEIAKHLRMKRTTVLGHLKRMADDGLLTKRRSVFFVDLKKMDTRIDDRGIERCVEVVGRAMRELKECLKGLQHAAE